VTLKTCDHDNRFSGVFGAKNVCIACQCEAESARATKLEAENVWLREAIGEAMQLMNRMCIQVAYETLESAITGGAK
jgi:hypothetical protein